MEPLRQPPTPPTHSLSRLQPRVHDYLHPNAEKCNCLLSSRKINRKYHFRVYIPLLFELFVYIVPHEEDLANTTLLGLGLKTCDCKEGASTLNLILDSVTIGATLRRPLKISLVRLSESFEEVLATWKSRLHEWGYVPIFCSVESKQGLDSLAFFLRERTTVIVGPSGVGKSSLINVLRNNDDPPVMEEGTLFDLISGSKWFGEQRVEVSSC